MNRIDRGTREWFGFVSNGPLKPVCFVFPMKVMKIKLENCFIQILSYPRTYVRIIYEKTKGQISQRPSLLWENKTSKLLQLFHERKFEPTSLPPSGIASFATSSHYEQRLTHQKRKTEWLLRATVSRGVAGMVAVMVCFSDFFIAIAIGGESLCFLRM